MNGEKDLDRLLKSLRARLHEDAYVFATLPDRKIPPELQPIMVFQEAEGTTLILKKSEAETRGIDHVFSCRMITLDIHSSLEAVGFIAHIASELAARGMGVNPVSGYYHDHLFIPEGREEEAMVILRQISADAAAMGLE
ncbi:MAG: ACT domain-containing protein [Pseudomonadota bacterium]